ncbi:hypothetical protein D3C76_295320 [compost metagenome]
MSRQVGGKAFEGVIQQLVGHWADISPINQREPHVFSGQSVSVFVRFKRCTRPSQLFPGSTQPFVYQINVGLAGRV